MIRFWDVLERAEKGEVVAAKDWDRMIGKAAAQVVADYDLKYDPEDPLPDDDALARTLCEQVQFVTPPLLTKMKDTRSRAGRVKFRSQLGRNERIE